MHTSDEFDTTCAVQGLSQLISVTRLHYSGAAGEAGRDGTRRDCETSCPERSQDPSSSSIYDVQFNIFILSLTTGRTASTDPTRGCLACRVSSY